MTATVFHVGFSKTATTSLQHNVFAHLSGIENGGKPYLDKHVAELFGTVTFAPVASYRDDDLAAHVASVRAAADRREVVALFSNEGFSYARHNDPALVARRLAAVAGDAEVLFVIREQRSWVLSLYFDDFSRGDNRFSVGRIGPWCAAEERKPRAGVFDMVDFAAVVRVYCEAFGRERVHVLTLEQMVREPAAFAARIAAVLRVEATEVATLLASGNRENTRPSRAGYWATLATRALLPGGVLHAGRRPWLEWMQHSCKALLQRGPRIVVDLPPAYAERVDACSRDGNRWLADEFDLPLQRWGYPL